MQFRQIMQVITSHLCIKCNNMSLSRDNNQIDKCSMKMVDIPWKNPQDKGINCKKEISCA